MKIERINTLNLYGKEDWKRLKGKRHYWWKHNLQEIYFLVVFNFWHIKKGSTIYPRRTYKLLFWQRPKI